jgi:15-cis-phytoene synthase
MTPEQYCEQKAAPRGSSLYYSVLFVPAEQRRAVIALHAFRLELVDAVDAAVDPGVARAKLLWWREELDAALAGHPHHPVMHALAAALTQFSLPREQLLEPVDGAQMDLDYNRYPDFATLEVYCHRTAGAIALLCARVLGYTQAATLEFARTLGIGLQLADLIADVGKHARHNRIYLPLDELERFGLATDDIVVLREDERTERLIGLQIERALSYFKRAKALLPREDRKQQRAQLTLAAIDRTLLNEIASLHNRTLNQRVALTPLRKLWIALRETWLGET